MSEEQAAIVKNDPLAFAIAAREGDVSDREITNVLEQAGVDFQTTNKVLDEVGIHMQVTRRKRGFKRVIKGFAVATIGIGVSIVTAFVLPSEFFIVATGALLYAVYCVLRGTYEVVVRK